MLPSKNGVFKIPNLISELPNSIAQEKKSLEAALVSMNDFEISKEELIPFVVDRIDNLKQIIETYSKPPFNTNNYFVNQLEALEDNLKTIGDLYKLDLDVRNSIDNCVLDYFSQFTNIKNIFNSVQQTLEKHQALPKYQQVYQQLFAQVKKMDEFLTKINDCVMHVEQKSLDAHFSFNKPG